MSACRAPRLPELVRRIDAIAKRYEVTMATFGHAGDGKRTPGRLLRPPPIPKQRSRVAAAFDDIFATAIELGGTITGEHGVGAAKLPYLQAQLGQQQTAAAGPGSNARSTRWASSNPGKARIVDATGELVGAYRRPHLRPPRISAPASPAGSACPPCPT